MGEYAPHDGALDAAGMRLAIVAARFNEHITSRLVDGARRRRSRARGVADASPSYWVPGAFELPLVAKRLAASGTRRRGRSASAR